MTIFVDDMQRSDSSSASLLAQLAQIADSRRLFIVTTLLRGAQALAPRAIEQLRERSSRETLRPLSQSDIIELLRSLFGDVPDLQVVGDWISRLGQGSPRASMELAQHLVDRGFARYADGTWTLPENLRGLDLPESFEQALEARVAALSPAAREILPALASVLPSAPLSIADIVQLFGERVELETIYAALEELSSANFVTTNNDIVEIRDAVTKQASLRSFSQEELSELHTRLAQLYTSEDGQRRILAVFHLHAAGADDAAYDELTKTASGNSANTFDAGLRSSQGVVLVEWALRHAKLRGVGPLELHRWRRMLLQLSATIEPRLDSYAAETLEQLRRDSGLVHYPELDPALDTGARLGICFQRAQSAYQATPEAERGFDPFTAIRELAVAAVVLSSTYALTWDCAGLTELKTLIAPLRGLAPALDILYRVIELSADTIVNGNSVIEQRRAVYAMFEAPAEGIDEATRTSARALHSFYLALEESQLGSADVLPWTEALIAQPNYAVLGWQARMMHHLWQGQARQANECRQQKELLALRDTESDRHLAISMLYEIFAYWTLGDLLGVARLLPQFERLGALYPGWRPWVGLVNALYHSLRGEQAGSERAIEQGLAEAAPGKHHAWQHLTMLYIETLAKRGAGEQAMAVVTEARRAIEQHALRLLFPTRFDLSVAAAMRAMGETAGARELIESRLATELERGSQGILIGQLHEASCRLALAEGDRPAALRHLQRVDEIYLAGRHPGLIARYERLAAEAGLAAEVSARGETAPAHTSEELAIHSEIATTARSWLMSLRNEQQRADDALAMLIESSRASGGYLFAVDAMTDVRLAATRAQSPPEPGLAHWVAEFAKDLVGTGSMETTDTGLSSLDSATADGAVGGYLQRFALGGSERGFYKLVAVVVLCSRDGAPLTLRGELLRAVTEALASGTGDGQVAEQR